MEAGGLRVQRRPPGRKRSFSLGRSLYTPAKKKPSGEEEVRGTSEAPNIANEAEGPRPKDCSSDDDLFGEYDSFADDASLVAQMDDIEEKCKLEAAVTPQTAGTGVSPSASVCQDSEAVELRSRRVWLTEGSSDSDLTEDLFDDLPCSQLLCIEDAEHNPDEHQTGGSTDQRGAAYTSCGTDQRGAARALCGADQRGPAYTSCGTDQRGAARALCGADQRVPAYTSCGTDQRGAAYPSCGTNERGPARASCNTDQRGAAYTSCGTIESGPARASCDTDQQGAAYTSITAHPNPKDGKRRSLRDSLKNTLAGNAKAHPPQISRTVQVKETVIREELDVAQRTAVPSSQIDLGPFYGLPSKVAELIERNRGIKKLYDWQHTCLTLESLRRRKNLIYSLPTSGGKTLVAEIVVLQELLCRRRDVLMILPYVAIVQEKVRGLSSFGVELEFLIEEYAGSKGRFPPIKRRTKNSLYIATIEKGHSLVNSLIETERVGDLGLVVVDELHMLSEGSRGATLEMTLSKILYTSQRTQIIGMSATLNNVDELQQFLKADYYTDNFRPVELKEYVKLRDDIYEVDDKAENGFTLSRVLNYKYSSNMQRLDPDHVIALVTEVIPNHSCLVFCPTKKNCENVAEMICKYLNKSYLSHREAEKKALIEDLKNTGNGAMCSVLKRTVPFGLAYHHSGLTSDERKLVEEAYSSGVLCLLTCTSTLAAGVNLPARRVVLRAPYVARDFLRRAQYKQMVGRAGRAGIDSAGESILIIQEKDKERVRELVSKPPESCLSSLMHDGGKGFQSLLLSLIGLKVARTSEEIFRFAGYTLFSVQQKHLSKDKSLWEMTKESLEYLADKGLVCSRQDPVSQQPVFEVSRLGQATYKGSIDVSYCDLLYSDLRKGLEGLVLQSHLHLLYLVTPYDMVNQCSPDWMIYFRQFNLLDPVDQKVAGSVGVPESFLARKISGQSVKKGTEDRAVHRLYLSFILHALTRELDIWTVSAKFNLPRGFIQNLLSSSASFSSCILHFCEELDEFWAYKALLIEVTKKLSYCVKSELIPLMEVAGVLEARAKQLYSAGYTSLAHLANADPQTMVKALEHLSKRQANQIICSAKILLNEKAEALQEEVEELLRLPTDLPAPIMETEHPGMGETKP